MILVDTSVWIDYLNGNPSQHTDALDAAIVEGIVAMGDLIFFEILQGIRDDREYHTTKQCTGLMEPEQVIGIARIRKTLLFGFRGPKQLTTANSLVQDSV